MSIMMTSVPNSPFDAGSSHLRGLGIVAFGTTVES